MKAFTSLFLVAALALALPISAATKAASKDAPSRAPAKGCTWGKIGGVELGLEAWVQRCDFGTRKIDFLVAQKSLLQRYSDGGAPEAVIEVIDLRDGETPAAGMRRIFDAHTEKSIAARCVAAAYRNEGMKKPSGVKRYSFVPNAAYQKVLAPTISPDEVGDPACGDWGDMPDGIQYFEVQPGNSTKRVLFVRVGQDEPLFDEQTLRLLP